jgi:uncharacterized protein (DUF1697 family)
MRYVALLRGINVGGRTLVKMADVKACFERLGFDGVSTYIASGNVLFETDEDHAARLAATIEASMDQQLGLRTKVVVLDRQMYAAIVKAIPKSWIGDGTMRANVAFVRPGTDAREVVRGLEPDPAIEQITAVDGAILWATRRDSLNRSAIRKLIGGAAYQELTIRSLNTTLKLDELLASGPTTSRR